MSLGEAGDHAVTMRVKCASFAFLLIVSALSGCGPKFVPVSGRVTLDGRPLESAAITFEPRAERGGTASDLIAHGITDHDGQYELRTVASEALGTIVGEHRVTITTAYSGVGADERTKLPEELLPAAYQDGSIVFTVTPEGSTQADFDVVTPRKRR